MVLLDIHACPCSMLCFGANDTGPDTGSNVQTHLNKLKAAHRRTDKHLSRYLTCGSDPSCYAMAAHLRCDVQRSAKLVKEALSIWAEVTGAKVNDLHDGIAFMAGEEDVLRFQVSVGEAFAVHEGQELH